MVQRPKDAPLVKLPLELKYAVGLMVLPLLGHRKDVVLAYTKRGDI